MIAKLEEFIGVRRARRRAHPIRTALTDLSARERFTLIQIGAYTGATANDPLAGFLYTHFSPQSPFFKPNATAILVEPWPRHFEQLCRNYAHLNVRCVNAAITTKSGAVRFSGLDVDVPADMPEWLAQLGSLDGDRRIALITTREHRPDLVPFMREHTVTREVEGLTIADLLRREDIAPASVDLLQIDAEGADYQILKSIDWRLPFRPQYINYESMLLGPDSKRALWLMIRHGYRVIPHYPDTFCVH